MNDIEVSVVIPTYNRLSLLKIALNSALQQDMPDSMEVIVVNDGSTDGTMDYLAQLDDPRLRLLDTDAPGSGGSAARNIGIRAARGRFVAFLDDDDSWYPSKLAKQLELMKGKQYPACVSNYRSTRDGKCLNIKGKVVEKIHLLKGNPFPTTGIVLDRTLSKSISFDELLPSGQDWDLLIRLFQLGPIGYLSDPVFEFNEGQHVRITAGGKRMIAINKNKAFLGPYWFRYRAANESTSHLRQGNSRVSRVLKTVKDYGSVPTLHALFDRVRNCFRA